MRIGQERDSFQVVVLNGQLWLFGGENNSGPYGWEVDLNDVWESSNGVNWNSEPQAGFQPRHGFTSMVYDNNIWVFGGLEGQRSQNDVWNSTNGTSWSQPTTAAGFEARSYFSGAVADGRMWIMGGKAISGAVKNDVWYSCDGINWFESTPAAAFIQGRAFLQSCLIIRFGW